MKRFYNSKYFSVTVWGVIIVALVIGGLVFMFGGKRYKVEYDGYFIGGRNSYRAGQKVTVKVPVATDETLTVYLDNEILQSSPKSDASNYVFEFTMPDHDIKLKSESVNDMICRINIEMLVDYFEKNMAVPDDTSTYEIVLNSYTETEAQIDVYTKASESDSEVKKTYIVPISVIDEVFEIIDNYDMKNWNSETDNNSITGKLYVCKFLGSEEYIRTTSENMPENGVNAFKEIKAKLSEYLDDKYLL